MTICQIEGCEEHYGCRLRNKGLQVSPKATPNRWKRGNPRTPQPNSWNAGIVYDERPGGTKVPILNPDMSPVRMKQGAEQRHKIADHLRKSRKKEG